jgi:hypothetical protein
MALFPFNVQSLTTLTAVGTTTAVEVTSNAVTFQVTVTDIDTNVVVRFEGSLDNTNFFNLDQGGADTTITANGTYGFALNGCPVKHIRLRLVSISGGTPSVASLVGAL